ncbi:BET1-like protein isoform X2 [Onychostruthus taczanowskii]|uniref:BET1-like protein isoform X2 n=1 Tax=Onychostruthus taczanowskii TaxID=356909 RepID=UPI001B805038|nr:BET1-like protein isoform X2 [Onychostruthus taczanowskii]
MAERGRGQSPSAMEDLLDVENKRMADSLASKVTRLKSLALDIDKDAEEQNRYLDGMGLQLDWLILVSPSKETQEVPWCCNASKVRFPGRTRIS